MNYYELTEYLEIEDGSQIQYFEEIADLIESDEHIEHEALQTLFSEVDTDITASLLDDYFNDITSGLPEEYSEMFSLLDQIRMELTGVIRSISDDDPETFRNFTDRFYRFRNWYVYDTEVSVLLRSFEILQYWPWAHIIDRNRPPETDKPRPYEEEYGRE